MSNYRNSNQSRIYVGNLPTNIRSKELDDLFYKFGKIVSIDLKNHRDPPFAFIEFSDPRDAEDAVYERDRYNYDGYKLRVEFPRNPGGGFRGRGAGRGRDRGGPKRSQYRCLVSGLPVTGSWQDLKDHMHNAGDICFADVYKDGTGVIEFSRYDDMKYAIKKFDDSKFRSHRGDETRIRVKEDYSKSLSVSPRYRKYKRHSRSRTPLSKSRSRSASSRSRSRSASSRSRSRSPVEVRKSRSRSPVEVRKSRSRSPVEVRKSRSRSPVEVRKSRSNSPSEVRKSRSRSQSSRSRSCSPDEDKRSRSNDEFRKSTKRSRPESPLPKDSTAKRQRKYSS